MLDDKGPLLFINTVQTDAKANNQNTFDSRFKVEDKTTFNDIKKLKNIIEMYNKKKPVLCRIFTANKEFEGVPYKLSNKVLEVLVEGVSQSIELNKLLTIEIIRF